MTRSTCTAYLYPSYATYKAIKASDGPALERLMMYWVVIGIVATGEGTVQWLIDW
jgi:receptor expression-enhancing protein 1/2/3/4